MQDGAQMMMAGGEHHDTLLFQSRLPVDGERQGGVLHAQVHDVRGRWPGINQRRVDVDKQADRRLASAMQHVAIGFAQGVAQEFVAHEATIDVAVLGVTARPRMGADAGGCAVAPHQA